MEIKEIKTTGLKREFEITITNKSIDQLVQNKISELAPKANIPGFRTGKVPHNIIKMRFGKQIFGEVVNESLNNASKKIVDDFKINAATQPKMDIKSLDEGKDIKVNYVVKNNVQAPINKGDKIGTLEVISDNNTVLISDLIALEDVEAKGFFGRLWSRFVLWIMSLFGMA